MIKTISLQPGVTLRCFRDDRFKQGFLSVQFILPMDRQEAALNGLVPAVLLRGCRNYPDMRAITLHLDDLYGGSFGPSLRRIGDFHATGLSCGFISDRFAMDSDRVLEPMVDFLRQLLLQPVLEKGAFLPDYVESEKKNLIATIAAQRNDKRAYANAQLFQKMCREDSFGIPRLGEISRVKEITPESAYAHYRKLLTQGRIDVFYVGEAAPQTVAELIRPIFRDIDRNYVNLPEQTPFHSCGGGEFTETMDVAQGKLCMGFTTPVLLTHKEFAAMQVFNTMFGGGMTSKLFMNVREKLSLCYDISSAYYGSKGIITVGAGIDCAQEQTTRQEILRQLDMICRQEFSQEEFDAAKQSLISGLRGIHDTPGGIENYYSTAAISGLLYTPEEYIRAVEKVQPAQVARVAQTVTLDTVYFLKGVQ